MPRVAYVNGHYLRHAEARVHIEDRGYQFADGVYEVVAVCNGRLLDAGPHLDRLDRSLKELRIDWPMSRRALELVLARVKRLNRLDWGLLYIQVTRGVAPRDHGFPAPGTTAPSVVVTARRDPPFDASRMLDGVGVILIPDLRWKRCDIKTISLLPNVLAKQAAREAGAYEAWMLDSQGFVTEGAASNAWIVTPEGQLVTRSTDEAILSGITRRVVLRLAEEAGVPLVERAFTAFEARAAREAFLTSATSFVKPVVKVDSTLIGDGRAGPLTRRLAELYQDYIARAKV